SEADTVMIGAAVTVVVALGPVTVAASLQARVGAPLAIVVPFASGLATFTTICTDPEAPAFRTPIVQETVAPDGLPPPVALTNEVLGGTGAVRTTPLALALPLFE